MCCQPWIRPFAQCAQDPYFPHGVVDLRYAISCESHGDKAFRVRTNQKTVNLEADSVPSRDEWVKSIRKVIFQAQNLGNNVKVSSCSSKLIPAIDAALRLQYPTPQFLMWRNQKL